MTIQRRKTSRRLGAIARAAALVAAALPGAKAGPAAAQSTPSPAFGDAAMFAYVGSFTSAQRNARGDGIHVYRADPSTGAFSHVSHLADLVNPSFLAVSHDQRVLYSVHGDEDYASAFAIDGSTGALKLLGRAATGGRNGVREAVDPSGRYLIVANYGSGSVAVLPIAADGSLKDQQQLVALPGESGPHKVEQTGSHPHDVVFDPSGRFVLVPDKGLDRVFVFSFDLSGKLTPTAQGSVRSRPGAGPRHLAFHPSLPVVWVLDELDSTIATYRFDAASGALTALQVQSTLPPEFTGYSTAAEIAVAPDGRFVYGSNRGHDSVTIFAADGQGQLRVAGWQPTGGKGPRFIGLDPSGRFLHAANEQGDTIVTLRRDERSGALTPTGQTVANPTPVTIVFAH